MPLLTLLNISRALFGRGTFGTFGDFLKLNPAAARPAVDAFTCGGMVVTPRWCRNDSPRTTAGEPPGEPSLEVLDMSPPNEWLRVTIMADLGLPLLASWTECPGL